MNTFDANGNYSHPPAEYHVDISTEAENEAWDFFLETTPGGYFTQTSRWGQVKTFSNKRMARIIITNDGKIVAGAQLIIHTISRLVTMVYVEKGPVFALEDPDLFALAFDAIHQVACEQRARILLIQPHQSFPLIEQNLSYRNFQPSLINMRARFMNMAPIATVRIDLDGELDHIFSRMKKTTRTYIRRGTRRGLVGREGTEADLGSFYRLLVSTSQRQNYTFFSESYFFKLWRILAPKGYVKLFMLEFEGEPVSAQLVIPFNDLVVTKYKGWSGDHKHLGPNYVLDWTTIQWAHAHGYRYYDYEGIATSVAKTVHNNTFNPATIDHGPTKYKLGFGGQVVALPLAYHYVFNPILRWGYSTVFPIIKTSPVRRRFMDRIRAR